MSVVLTRVDDRLIHGQVVVGWGQALVPDRIVLADDAVAEEQWEHDIYRAAVPPGIETAFVSVEEAARRFAEWDRAPERTLVLVGSIEACLRLCAAAPGVRAINLGGIHQADDRRQRLPYLFLSESELAQLEGLEERGVTIVAQDLPTSPAVALDELA